MKRFIRIFTVAFFCVLVVIFFISQKVFIALSIVGIVLFFTIYTLYVLNAKVKRTNWYCNVIPDMSNYPNNEWYRKNTERNYDLAIIGSTSALYSYNFDIKKDIKYLNWANQPQSLTYSFKVLRTYFSILKKNGKLFITLSPFSGLDSDSKWKKESFDKYYHILNQVDIPFYKDVVCRRKFPLFFNTKESLKRLIKDVPKKQINLRKQENIDYEKDAHYWVELWKKEFDILSLDFELTKENQKGLDRRIQLLNDIVCFCKEREIEPILILPPVHAELLKFFTPMFQHYYIDSFIDPILTKHKILFYNFLSDKDFLNDSYFYNSYFLSELGARKLTDKLLKEISFSNTYLI